MLLEVKMKKQALKNLIGKLESLLDLETLSKIRDQEKPVIESKNSKESKYKVIASKILYKL